METGDTIRRLATIKEIPVPPCKTPSLNHPSPRPLSLLQLPSSAVGLLACFRSHSIHLEYANVDCEREGPSLFQLQNCAAHFCNQPSATLPA